MSILSRVYTGYFFGKKNNFLRVLWKCWFWDPFWKSQCTIYKRHFSKTYSGPWRLPPSVRCVRCIRLTCDNDDNSGRPRLRWPLNLTHFRWVISIARWHDYEHNWSVGKPFDRITSSRWQNLTARWRRRGAGLPKERLFWPMLTTHSDVRIAFSLDLFCNRQVSLLCLLDVAVYKVCVNPLLCRVLNIILHQQYMHLLAALCQESNLRFRLFLIQRHCRERSRSRCYPDQLALST